MAAQKPAPCGPIGEQTKKSLERPGAARSCSGFGEKPKLSVLVVNPVWNGPQIVRRRRAEHLVAEGRAVFVAANQIRLHRGIRPEADHPKNRKQAMEAAKGYSDATPFARWVRGESDGCDVLKAIRL